MTSEQNRRGMTAGRRLSSVIVVCSLFAVACSRCAAESPPHIEQVRIGLPGGQAEQESARSRYGAWAPVYVKLKAGPEGSARDRFRIRVETTDSENTAYHYDTSLPALVPNQDYLAVAYIRPGAAGNDFKIQLLTASGQSVAREPPVSLDGDKDTLDAKDVLYLTIGARLPGMKRALLADPALANVADDDLTDKKGTALRLHGRRFTNAGSLVRLRGGGRGRAGHRQPDLHQ